VLVYLRVVFLCLERVTVMEMMLFYALHHTVRQLPIIDYIYRSIAHA
jgi:hypothetical protein